ncbi:hypothetical protein [Roseovarius sp.]|uniref:hypothetical protein n=1 Tax=Roseovarius sp. TaxID=1486281 RepID=UPI003A97A652
MPHDLRAGLGAIPERIKDGRTHLVSAERITAPRHQPGRLYPAHPEDLTRKVGLLPTRLVKRYQRVVDSPILHARIVIHIGRIFIYIVGAFDT